jgi:hypothetical protein
MEKPKFFTRSRPVGDTTPGNPTDWGKIVKLLGGIIVVLLILGFVATQIFARWQELAFAYEHPQFVQSVRMQYESREAALNQEFVTGQSNETKMLQEIKQTLEQQKTKQSNSF